MAVATLKPLAPQEAVDYFRAKGANLDPTFSWTDMWQADHATAFTVAKSAGFDILAAKDVYGPEKAVAFAKEFSGQVAGLIRCDDNQRIASGEFLALLLDCGGTDIFKLVETDQLIWPKKAHAITRASFVVKFARAARPRRFSIIPPDRVVYGREGDSPILERFMRLRGFIAPDEPTLAP